MSDTPRTDADLQWIESHEVGWSGDVVNSDLAEWLERSRRDNIRKRWGMRREMRSFDYTFTDYVLNKSWRMNVYQRYLQGLKK